ncbi:MAG: hypothetical protein GY729_07090 [Desulfobacteraceae bacterium]|nr:hypothetical protein [Desulfobacteraceae bacterium]
MAVWPASPTSTTLLTPLGTIDDAMVQFTWNMESTATWYRLYVWDNSQQKQFAQWYESSQVCSGTTCTVTLNFALSNDDYQWFIKTWNDDGSTWSSAQSFTVSSSQTKPQAITLVSPSGTSENASQTFVWNQDISATWYQLFVWDNNQNKVVSTWYEIEDNYSQYDEAACADNSCSVTVSSGFFSGSHEWFVRAYNDYGTGAWSNGMAFTLELPKSYPSVFQAWSVIENKPSESDSTKIARHDLIFDGTWVLDLGWEVTENQPYEGLSTSLDPELLTQAQTKRNELLLKNPDLIIIASVLYREGEYITSQNEGPEYWEVGYLPANSSYWLKDGNGDFVPAYGEDADGDGTIETDEVLSSLIDFTDADFQNIIIQKAKELNDTGLFDGIFLDWWNETTATTGNYINWQGTIKTLEEETQARLDILKGIRNQVDDDFLILVNTNTKTVPQSAPYINGIYMESAKDNYGTGYSLTEIQEIETTLTWAEATVATPRINCLEGWRVVYDYTGDLDTRVEERDSSENKKWMRMFTTLSLTHSDGYVLFGDDNTQPSEDHLHNWHDFWDANLGNVIGQKAQSYNNTEGLFIREFENGWAVYNRSGSSQNVTFTTTITGKYSSTTATAHTIPDFDGEIFLKQ